VDIVEFLTARYDEEAASARRAAAVARGAEWASDIESAPGSCFLGSEGVRSFAQVGVSFGAHSIAEHIAVHDPARVLADIAMRQRLVEAYPKLEQRLAEIRKNDPATYSYDHAKYAGLREAAQAVLLQFASLYAEHPDYDPAWRIDG
jgi:Family of unknown function (DUF6221)